MNLIRALTIAHTNFDVWTEEIFLFLEGSYSGSYDPDISREEEIKAERLLDTIGDWLRNVSIMAAIIFTLGCLLYLIGACPSLTESHIWTVGIIFVVFGIVSRGIRPWEP
jgi:hypothetical protein